MTLDACLETAKTTLTTSLDALGQHLCCAVCLSPAEKADEAGVFALFLRGVREDVVREETAVPDVQSAVHEAGIAEGRAV